MLESYASSGGAADRTVSAYETAWNSFSAHARALRWRLKVVEDLTYEAGPMLRGNWHGQPLGSGSDVWKYWAQRRDGALDDCTWRELEDGIARSFGTCMTMGTASTMAAAAEALGMTLAGASSMPAADAGHPRLATGSGPWEASGPTYRFSEILSRKGIPHSVDDWGPDGGHDWPYWKNIMNSYLSRLPF